MKSTGVRQSSCFERKKLWPDVAEEDRRSLEQIEVEIKLQGDLPQQFVKNLMRGAN
jgi:hypothetical protein